MTNDDHDDFKAGPDDTSTIIRRLNDQLRVSLTGGKVMMTPGIIDLGLETQARVLAAVRAFDAFTDFDDDDLTDTHAIGDLEVEIEEPGVHRWRELIFFRVDAFVLEACPRHEASQLTLTIMLASEW